MSIKELWVVAARYSDGSGAPEILAAFEDQFSAEKLVTTIAKSSPNKELSVLTVQMWPEIKADVGHE